jgi:DNA polymerase III delta prime subunit
MLLSKLIGQEESIELLEKVLDDPPHLFFSGGYGSGKTTLLHEFLSAYFKQKGQTPNAESILWLSSEQDRGIHCVRQSVAEFVRHSSATPGVYRWIVVDDADSLPIISQQALRRPMETHDHTTRFLFCSRHYSDLIQPLRSRCMHVELDMISPYVLVGHFLERDGYTNLKLDPNAYAVFMSIAQTPTEIRSILRILGKQFGSETQYTITAQDILSHFSAPSFSLCLNLLKAFIRNDQDKMIRIFMDLWFTGISYEDFLYELNSSIYMLGILPAKTAQRIHQVLLRGWMCFAQGKTHSLDVMRLFISEGFTS